MVWVGRMIMVFTNYFRMKNHNLIFSSYLVSFVVVVVVARPSRPHPEVLVRGAARGTPRPLGGPPRGSRYRGLWGWQGSRTDAAYYVGSACSQGSCLGGGPDLSCASTPVGRDCDLSVVEIVYSELRVVGFSHFG